MKFMNPKLPPAAAFPRLRNRLLGPLALIAAASVLVPATARAGFFDRFKEATNALQKIKQEVSNQLASKPAPAKPPASQPAPANSQPASTPASPANQPASTPAPATPQPAVTPNSVASQPPAATPSGTPSGSLTIPSASVSPGPLAVAQKVVGPYLSSGVDANDTSLRNYTISRHGSHLATAHMEGSRYVVTVDGVDGPRVNGIVRIHASFEPDRLYEAVAMSDDGSHTAYLARYRGQRVVFEDGRKILQFPLNGGIMTPCYLVFSPHGGAHLLLAAQEAGSSAEKLWVDGKPAPVSIAEPGQGDHPIVTFSADGQHYLYLGTAPENGSPNYVLVVDGKKVGYSVAGIVPGSSQFTGDGRHVLCVTQRSVGQKTVASVLLDGKPVVTGDQIDSVVTAPRGSSFAAVVQDHNNTQCAVYLNGTEVPFTRFAGNDNSVPLFSPNGKRLAVACNFGAGNAYVVLDGKQGDTYDRIHDNLRVFQQTGEHLAMKFSPDSQSFAYFAVAGSKTFAVVDGHEYDPGFSNPFGLFFSPEGHHVVAFGNLDGGVNGLAVFIDGRRVGSASYSTFVFSPHGSHWADFSSDGLAVDGQVLSFTANGNGNNIFRFSPDGKKLAVWATDPDPPHNMALFLYNLSTKRTVRLTPGDEASGASIPATTYLTFSPDSQHLYFACPETAGGQFIKAVIYVDGKKTAAQFDYSAFPPPGPATAAQEAACWYVGADDKLHALCAVGNEVERITITPPPGGLEGLGALGLQGGTAPSKGASSKLHIAL